MLGAVTMYDGDGNDHALCENNNNSSINNINKNNIERAPDDMDSNMESWKRDMVRTNNRNRDEVILPKLTVVLTVAISITISITTRTTCAIELLIVTVAVTVAVKVMATRLQVDLVLLLLLLR